MSIGGTTSATSTYYQPPGPPPLTPPAGQPEVPGTQLHLHSHRKTDGGQPAADQTGTQTQSSGTTGGLNIQA